MEEEIYIEQLEGFEGEGREQLVCKLKRSLYGLKQAPRQWYKKFDSFMTENEFKHIVADPCVYIKWFGESFVLLLLYVDDMLNLGKDIPIIDKLKKELSK